MIQHKNTLTLILSFSVYVHTYIHTHIYSMFQLFSKAKLCISNGKSHQTTIYFKTNGGAIRWCIYTSLSTKRELITATNMLEKYSHGDKKCDNILWVVHYARPVLAFGYCHRLRLWVCVSVCVCINHELVRTITHRPFKLESLNLDQRCKTPGFRSLLFLVMIDFDLQGQI